MYSNYTIYKSNVPEAVQFLKDLGYNALKDVAPNDELKQFVVTDDKNKTFWLINDNTLEMTTNLIKLVSKQNPIIKDNANAN